MASVWDWFFCGFFGSLLVVLVMAVVFGPSRYGVVGFDLGSILSYGFDSHCGCDCGVWWVF